MATPFPKRRQRGLMSALIEDESRMEEIIVSGDSLLVLFYASWCGFCRRFLPIFEKHANGPNCYRVSTDQAKELENKHSIEYVPTVLFFSKGTVQKRLDGMPAVGLNEKMLLDFMNDCGLDVGAN
jgi:thioredoxin 1